MKWDSNEVLRTLCCAPGAGGMRQAPEAAAELLKPYIDSVSIDSLGSVVGIKKSKVSDAPTLMLEAHIDEIGMVVTGYDKAGFLVVSNCGGIDVRVLVAAEVVVWGDQPYRGVFCSTPPHLTDDKKQLPELKEMGIDIGLKEKELETHIPLGSRVTFVPEFRELANGRVSCKALDDRSGVASVLYAAHELAGEDLSVNMVYCFAEQEEIGSQGSATSAFGVFPNLALAVDVSFAETPDSDLKKCGRMGRGPMIGCSPILDTVMFEKLKRLAEIELIPYQVEVMAGGTGTDADAINATRTGIRTGLLSIPLRFMHTPVEMIQVADMEMVGDLMVAFARQAGEFLAQEPERSEADA